MACNGKYPVNMMLTKEVCEEECSFNFDYNKNSSCLVTNRGDYLEVKVDGPNTVLFNNYQVGVKGFRIFQPSLHLFNGMRADAEIIIEHKGAGRTLLVCLPVTAKDADGNSTRFFHQFIPVIPDEINAAQSINVNQWSLNAIVPNAPFYFYNGSLPYPPCDGDNNIIVFAQNHGPLIHPDDFALLETAIQSVPLTAKQRLNAVAKNTTIVMMNNVGAQAPGAATKEHVIFEDCQPIDGMGGKTKSDSPDQKGGKTPTALYVLLILVGVLALAAAIQYLCGAGNSLISSSKEIKLGGGLRRHK
tara:strand:+ start:433 stop:1338 length:906 start_codon:yes stop_codon:yes gene_type:complete